MSEAAVTEVREDSKTTTKSATDDVQALRDKIAALEKEKESWQSSKDATPSLNDKVRREREDREKKDSSTKNLESALTFNLTSADFLKANESILPKEIGEIFQAAEKEKYESAIEKANATKAAVIQSFFTQQVNVDLLTDNQKLILSDYLKLTKNAKEEKAKDIYENLFEPALGMLKRVKKAEELGRNKMGFRDGSKGDTQYKEKLMNLSRKHFLGETK
jgi:hypothetical protein